MSGDRDQVTLKDVTDIESAKTFARDAISSTYFDVCIGVVIVCNAAAVSLEQELELNGHNTIAFKVLDSIFLVIYMVELWLRIFAQGFRHCIQDNWIRCDIFLIILGVLSAWILEPIMGSSSLGPLMILRMLRLLRLVKTARILKRIHMFWMLIRGLMNSSSIMLYALSTLLVIIYIFACVSIELMTKAELNKGSKADPDFQEHVEKYFRNLPQAMLTLVRFIAMDNASTVYKPLIDKNPWLAVYFVMVILVTRIVLMNLITAVIFVSVQEENQIEKESAQKNAEDGWADLIRNLKGVFTRLDPDRMGKLIAPNMVQMHEEDRQMLIQALGLDEGTKPAKIFATIDRFKRQEVTIGEFYECVFESVMGRGEINMKRMERQFEKMYWRQKDIYDTQQEEYMTYKKLYDNVESMIDAMKGWNINDKTSPRDNGPISPSAQSGETIQLLPNGSSKRPESQINGLHDEGLLSLAVSKASELSDMISSWENSMRITMTALQDFTDAAQKGLAPEPKKIRQLERQVSPDSNNSAPLKRQVSPGRADRQSLAIGKKQNTKPKNDEDRSAKFTAGWI